MKTVAAYSTNLKTLGARSASEMVEVLPGTMAMESESLPALRSSSMSTNAEGRSLPALTIVLPIFNEELNVGRLFDRIDDSLKSQRLVYRILAVDDGSTDRTSEVLEAYRSRMSVRVLRHDVNQGLGAAIRSGLTEALSLSSEEDVIVTMDADESHAPSLIASMIEAIDRGFDVVIASRFQPASRCQGVPIHRQFLSTGCSTLFRILFPTPGVRDFTCGYRAYRVSTLRVAREKYGETLFEFDGFQCMVDLLLKLRAVKARFTEVPAVLRYDLKEGQSKMRIFQTVTRTLGLALLRRTGR
jgi:dolichol-phosphate mannosyltransferase